MRDQLRDQSGRDESDVDHLRQRVHKLADIVQNQEGKLREHSVLLEVTAKQIESVRASSATIEQLTHASELMKSTIKSTEDRLTSLTKSTEDRLASQITGLTNDLTPIKRGVYWAVTLIIGAVLMAMLTLLLNGPPPKP